MDNEVENEPEDMNKMMKFIDIIVCILIILAFCMSNGNNNDTLPFIILLVEALGRT